MLHQPALIFQAKSHMEGPMYSSKICSRRDIHLHITSENVVKKLTNHSPGENFDTPQ